MAKKLYFIVETECVINGQKYHSADYEVVEKDINLFERFKHWEGINNCSTQKVVSIRQYSENDIQSEVGQVNEKWADKCLRGYIYRDTDGYIAVKETSNHAIERVKVDENGMEVA